MKKLLVVLLLLLTVNLLIGCNDTEKYTETMPAGTVANLADQNEQGTTEESSNQAPAYEHGSTDYSMLQGDWKLKVSKDEELYRLTAMLEYLGSTGINIEEVNQNEVQGSIYSVQGPPSYRQSNVAFSGVIEEGILRTTYEDIAWEYTGTMELRFEEERIIAKITRDKTESFPMWGIPEGEFVFNRAIETEKVELASDEKVTLEAILYPATKELLKPFEEDGGVIEYPQLQLMLEDRQNPDIYYAIFDYIFEHTEEGRNLEYQYLIELQKSDAYTIRAIKEVEYPIDFSNFDF